MAYERNTAEGIRLWLTAEVNSPGWNSASIAKGLTEDVVTMITPYFSQFDSRVKQGVLLATMCMRKGDLMLLGDNLNKIIEIALHDSDDFVQTTAHILKDYPSAQFFDLNIDGWSQDFRALLQTIGSTVKKTGINFHPPEDMLLQHNARITPQNASSTYSDYKSTHVHHFTLTTNANDIISNESRHARFSELVESEERFELAEAQQAQVVAQKRAGAELSSKAKRVASPTSNTPNPFPFPPHRNSPASNSIALPGSGRTGFAPPRSLSMGSVGPNPTSGSSSLFTKRPARPTRPVSGVAGASGGGGGLFIKSNKPASSQRPMQRSATTNSMSQSNLPRGLQRVQKTQMLDFNAATAIEQNTATALKKAQDDKKAQAEAKKQEALDKKKRAAEEKREREEKKKAQKAAAAAAKQAAQAAKEAAAREAKEARESAKEVKAEAAAGGVMEDGVKSPTSAPTSPKTPTSPISPKIKYEHVFAIPALPAHHTQQQQQRQQQQQQAQPDGKFTTF
ncbi:hypothetical protein [Parasitella parasitica]|uniref:NELF-A N-terminal domain-containing protein n=1 Tax=Parasitella parasitica TaxID=35722 RepID=A0A0B7MUG5_9FUNG|nr:hypothetical protein [Parasitella parasitica]